jgi:hypothetical protein
VRDTQEWLRLRANAAGANIGKLENAASRRTTTAARSRKPGFDAWWAAERPRWDLRRMVDEETGQPFTETRLDRSARWSSDDRQRRLFEARARRGGRLSFANRSGSTASSITRAMTTGRRARRNSAPARRSTRCSAK